MYHQSTFFFFFFFFFFGEIFVKKFKNQLQFSVKILLKKFSSFFTGKSLVKFFQNHTLQNIFLKLLQLVPNLTPIRKLLCTFLYLCYCYPRPPLIYLKGKKIKGQKMDSLFFSLFFHF